ncbi:UNVERIFIED_CONTAM: D-serine deaminase-like pyridoxal phosphate-dependent protein [Brevibacillus sp. OAP136]
MGELLLEELDTPSLLVDLDRLEQNLQHMQEKANAAGVKLRPHTKTHKMADIARLQLEYGAAGITVAKLSEAEAMAAEGIDNIFIATQIVGKKKLERLRTLAGKATIRVAVDSIEQVEQIASFFGDQVPVSLMIEVDTGQHRCGLESPEAVKLADFIVGRFTQVSLAGLFTHEGHAYHAVDREELKRISLRAQRDLIEASKRVEDKWGIQCEKSIGCTLSQLGGEILPDITEIRPGTYVFYDAAHAYFLGHSNFCAATVLATVTSKSGVERIVADAGAKSFTIDQRSSGIVKTSGFGIVKGHPDLLIQRLSDEHAVIVPGTSLVIGERIEVIPNHVCPTINLYDQAYAIRNGKVEKMFKVHARGCNQ